MSTEQFAATLVGFLIANGTIVWAIFRWGVARAIEYTHLQRDVKELQGSAKIAVEKHEQVMNDLKGLSLKINRTKEELSGKSV